MPDFYGTYTKIGVYVGTLLAIGLTGYYAVTGDWEAVRVLGLISVIAVLGSVFTYWLDRKTKDVNLDIHDPSGPL